MQCQLSKVPAPLVTIVIVVVEVPDTPADNPFAPPPATQTGAAAHVLAKVNVIVAGAAEFCVTPPRVSLLPVAIVQVPAVVEQLIESDLLLFKWPLVWIRNASALLVKKAIGKNVPLPVRPEPIET